MSTKNAPLHSIAVMNRLDIRKADSVSFSGLFESVRTGNKTSGNHQLSN
jgi:hypothetical protein